MGDRDSRRSRYLAVFLFLSATFRNSVASLDIVGFSSQRTWGPGMKLRLDRTKRNHVGGVYNGVMCMYMGSLA